MASSLDRGGHAASAATPDSDESWGEISEDADDVEELRRRLQLESEQARAMEKRAVEAEEVAAWLKGDLDQRSRSSTERSRPAAATQEPDFREILALREELHKLTTHVAKKQGEVLDLTGRNQDASEQLERERQHVLDLECTEADLTDELGGIDGALRLNQQLQDELKYMRGESQSLKERISSFRGQKENLRQEIDELQRSRSDTAGPDDEEMERLSLTVGGQLMSVEVELAAKTKEVTDLCEPFMRQMHDLLEAARLACQRLNGDSSRTAPALFDPRSRDVRGALRGILELLHYMVEVLSREPRADAGFGDGSDRSGSSGDESVKPSRTIPGGDGAGRSSSAAMPQQEELLRQPQQEDRSWGWNKRWTCTLDA